MGIIAEERREACGHVWLESKIVSMYTPVEYQPLVLVLGILREKIVVFVSLKLIICY